MTHKKLLGMLSATPGIILQPMSFDRMFVHAEFVCPFDFTPSDLKICLSTLHYIFRNILIFSRCVTLQRG